MARSRLAAHSPGLTAAAAAAATAIPMTAGVIASVVNTRVRIGPNESASFLELLARQQSGEQLILENPAGVWPFDVIAHEK